MKTRRGNLVEEETCIERMFLERSCLEKQDTQHETFIPYCLADALVMTRIQYMVLIPCSFLDLTLQ